MKWTLIILLSAFNVMAHEKEVKTKADFFATGTFSSPRVHPWPFPLLSIGHNMQSFQDYGGSPYWHDGLDIRSVSDQMIYASAGGRVVNLENYVAGDSLYWEVAILDDEGFVWKYHHVDRKSIPEEVINAFRNGERIEAGAVIGKVVRWPVFTFGELYHHLHLLIVGKDGKYINPLLLLTPLDDRSSPVIRKIGIAIKHRPIEGQVVSGPHALFLDASDLILHEKFILPPHKITYRIDGAQEKIMWEFVHLPSEKNDTDFINDFYMEGTCGNYRCRKFYFNLNFSQNEPRKEMHLSPGNHSVDVTVEDLSGNKSSGSFEWKVL